MISASAPGAVLITGASGTVGRSLVEHLLAAGQRVRAGVPDPARAHLPAGVEVVRLDFTDPATAGPALAGVDRLFLLRPPAISDVATAFGPLVAAAGEVRRVVVLSVMGVNPALPHWRMERMVTGAGLAMTALRPAYFAQNLITAFGEEIREDSRFSLASGAGRVSFVDTRDIAAVAARVLADVDAYPPGPLTLTGPQALTFSDVAALLTAELGRPITYRRQSLWRRRTDLRARGLPSAYVNVQLVIDLTTRLGLAAKVTGDVAQILGRPPTPMDEFVHDHRIAW
jgi:uncharacterized protein YbjT (DUF2867 family)